MGKLIAKIKPETPEILEMEAEAVSSAETSEDTPVCCNASDRSDGDVVAMLALGFAAGVAGREWWNSALQPVDRLNDAFCIEYVSASKASFSSRPRSQECSRSFQLRIRSRSQEISSYHMSLFRDVNIRARACL